MPLFPKIASPCPYVNRLSEIMDGDVCRMCKREVFDLTAMSDAQRVAFVAGCKHEVCVSYSIPLRPAFAAAAIAAALAGPSAASAQRRPQPPVPPPPQFAVTVAGGIAPPPQVQMVPVPQVVERAEDLPPLYQEPAEQPPPSGTDAAKPPKG